MYILEKPENIIIYDQNQTKGVLVGRYYNEGIGVVVTENHEVKLLKENEDFKLTNLNFDIDITDDLWDIIFNIAYRKYYNIS